MPWENAMWREESSGKWQEKVAEKWGRAFIKRLTLYRICMDHKDIKGFDVKRASSSFLLVITSWPTFANFCYEVSCHVKWP
jgi:hypothetical protein